MLKRTFILFIFLSGSLVLSAQDKEKINVISRPVEGEIRTLYNDTLFGEIKVLGAQDYYITSIEFKQKGKSKEIFSAFDIKRFRQVVPFPDRPKFGVDEVYYESRPVDDDPYKKAFYPIDEWK